VSKVEMVRLSRMEVVDSYEKPVPTRETKAVEVPKTETVEMPVEIRS
jgi:hypothetical protein